MRRRNAPGELEAEVLRRVRAANRPLTGREVWAAFTASPTPDPAPARTTILTVLARLEHKGLVRRIVHEDATVFAATSPEYVAVAEQMERLLAHAEDRRAVLHQFAGLLDAADLRTLTDGIGHGG